MYLLAKPSGPVRRAASALMLLLLLGCSAPTAAPAAVPAGPVNDVDVMFLQMGLAQNAEADRVAELAVTRAANPAIKAVASELRGQFRTEDDTMNRWLTAWSKPVTADPSADAHAGHGDLHALRESDFAELAATKPRDFDRTVVSLLLGSLHNSVETQRMEALGGSYPDAKVLATNMTTARQSRIQRLLRLTA